MHKQLLTAIDSIGGRTKFSIFHLNKREYTLILGDIWGYLGILTFQFISEMEFV